MRRQATRRTAADGRRPAEEGRGDQASSTWDADVPDPAVGRVLGGHTERRWYRGRNGWNGWWRATVRYCRAGPALGLGNRGFSGPEGALPGGGQGIPAKHRKRD